MSPSFLTSLALALQIATAAAAANASPPAPEVFEYKSVEGVSIKADVYAPKSDRARPVVVWIHGGALMLGSRKNVPPQLVDLARKENYILVSIGYRLAPETLLPEIVADVRDALSWVRDEGPELFGADPKKVVVAGASAGGYLAQISGIGESPLPVAIVSYWGYGDISGDWCTTPNPKFGGKQKTPTREEAFADIGKKAITETTKEDYGKRSKLFLYMKRLGLWTKVVSGIDPNTSPGKLEPFCPLRNLGEDFPPIFLVHGTKDRDVPVGQSIAMNEALEKIGGDVELITVEGGGHGLWGGDKGEIEAAFEKSFAFIRDALGKR